MSEVDSQPNSSNNPADKSPTTWREWMQSALIHPESVPREEVEQRFLPGANLPDFFDIAENSAADAPVAPPSSKSAFVPSSDRLELSKSTPTASE